MGKRAWSLTETSVVCLTSADHLMDPPVVESLDVAVTDNERRQGCVRHGKVTEVPQLARVRIGLEERGPAEASGSCQALSGALPGSQAHHR
eukprot:763929-Hanusia_phi.AAC.9